MMAHEGVLMTQDSVTLYFKQGSSDKVYKAWIESDDNDLATVHFGYGRRGAALTTGVKTKAPVSLEKARKILDKLLDAKRAKGYTEGADGQPYMTPSGVSKATGILPQLLTPITLNDLESYFTNNEWWMQEKHDGRRLLVQTKNGHATPINRRGLECGAPEKILEALSHMSDDRDMVFDGELVGDTYYVFDVCGPTDANLSYRLRYIRLNDLYTNSLPRSESFSNGVIRVTTAKTEAEKRHLFEKLISNKNAEGVVFKMQSSPYTVGRPASGGSQVKFKFYSTASVWVESIKEDRRSVRMGLYTESGDIISVGAVTIPPNHDIPKVMQVIEVRYLYAYPGGSLYQPVYLGIRDDILVSECITGQLKYKHVQSDGEDE